MVIENLKPGAIQIWGWVHRILMESSYALSACFRHQAHLYPATLLGEQQLNVLSNIHIPPISNGVQTRAQDFPYQIRFLQPPSICHWIRESPLRMTLFLKPESLMHLPASYICKSDRIPGVGIIGRAEG